MYYLFLVYFASSLEPLVNKKLNFPHRGFFDFVNELLKVYKIFWGEFPLVQGYLMSELFSFLYEKRVKLD